jgi:spermidine synthase
MAEQAGLLKKIVSYLYPIILKTYSSGINGILEVTLSNGRKILDTARSNYSYGSVQRILERGLKEIHFNQTIKSVLVLGLGGGSIVQTIRVTFKSEAFITLVEIDPEMIAIAKKEFGIAAYPGIRIIQADAVDFIKTCRDTFDLIVVDVFIIDTIPAIFTEPDFLIALTKRLNPRAKLIYNTMRQTLDRTVFQSLISQLAEQGLRIKVAELLGDTNDLILGEKNG